MITLIGINHRTAPIEVRERLAWADGEVGGVVAEVVSNGASGGVLLSTCNRIEFYVTEPTGPALAEVWRHTELRLGEPAERFAYVRQDQEAVRHLFRVAAGLDSMVLGESEIQGQVRRAWELARAQAGPVLSRLFQMALRVGGRVRAETALGSGAASVPSASVELAKKIFGNLAGRRAIILGSGDMAELAMACLSSEGVRTMLVAHRNLARAEEIAARLGGRATSYDDAWELFHEVDIVISSTAAPHVIVEPAKVAGPLERRGDRPLCILDIAVPRDVDPDVGRFDNVFLYDIDDLQEVATAGLGGRKREVPRAETIVTQELGYFWEWYQGRGVVDAIRALRRHAEGIRDQELARVMQKLGHLSADDREAVAYLARALTNKLIHEPTVRLRGSVGNGKEGQMTDAVRYLFDLADAFPTEDDEGDA